IPPTRPIPPTPPTRPMPPPRPPILASALSMNIGVRPMTAPAARVIRIFRVTRMTLLLRLLELEHWSPRSPLETRTAQHPMKQDDQVSADHERYNDLTGLN